MGSSFTFPILTTIGNDPSAVCIPLLLEQGIYEVKIEDFGVIWLVAQSELTIEANMIVKDDPLARLFNSIISLHTFSSTDVISVKVRSLNVQIYVSNKFILNSSKSEF